MRNFINIEEGDRVKVLTYSSNFYNLTGIVTHVEREEEHVMPIHVVFEGFTVPTPFAIDELKVIDSAEFYKHGE